MTRAQRRIRNKKLRAASAGLPSAYSGDLAARMGLTENPNTGKRHGRDATHRYRDGFTLAELDRIDAARRAYVPLTVSTPIRRARIAPKVTSYTI